MTTYFINCKTLDELKKAYREELKARPGIETKLDIEKSRWEH